MIKKDGIMTEIYCKYKFSTWFLLFSMSDSQLITLGISKMSYHICTALSMSGASSKTTSGLLPPSSSETLLRLDFPAACMINFPTSVDPVNATLKLYYALSIN